MYFAPFCNVSIVAFELVYFAQFYTVYRFSYLEYDTGLRKRFSNFTHIEKQNLKMEAYQLLMSCLKIVHNKSRLHNSDPIQYFCLCWSLI